MVLVCATIMTACQKKDNSELSTQDADSNMFGLTEEEQNVYTHYAAGVLMKYNADTNMRVLEGNALTLQEAKEEKEKEQALRREQLKQEYEAKQNQQTDSSQSEGNVSGGFGEETTPYITDMAEATGTDAFTIQYDGYETAYSYPESGEDAILAIDATPGNVLLVTKFKVTNTSSETAFFDMFAKQPKFRITINGEVYKVQYTLLLNDLSMYAGEINGGETVDTILIFEVPEMDPAFFNDMELKITTGDEVRIMKL